MLFVSALALSACGKKSDAPAAGSGSASSSAAADPKADFVHVLGHHNPGKPTDPVVIDLPKFEVTKAAFDPANPEGGTAQLTLDLASLSSNSPKRDKHLSSPDYLDVAKFATVTIDVDNVKKQSGSTYTADANISIHGVQKKLPVTFDVVETLPDGVRIHAKQAWKRSDFSIGAPEGGDETTADAQEIELQLTLHKK
ncbi:MAG TPA: YceI family protein [Kofleriaceae bacterium]|nr:YceI family protein [Kofleriaceae bacterium]